ncbi:MAG TPA: hypothetical protein VFV95_05870 [Vicinamibacterales bacterium]|nr:hypothetical protein [Vicinamibacterales bacterium]
MNLAHVHLLLNHTPTIGFGVAICLYAVAFFGKNETLKRTGLVLLFLAAVLAIPTYISGNFAELRLCPDGQCLPGVSRTLIRAHEDAALLAFCVMEITGFMAWLALWQWRAWQRVPGWNAATVLLLSLVTFGAMANAATKGGSIRHSEIHATGEVVAADQTESGSQPAEEPDATASSGDGEGTARWLGEVMSGTTGVPWLWAASETVHFVGLCLLFTVVLFVNLRLLGMAKSLSFVSLYQLLPLGMIGFGMNLVTGIGFFLAKPAMYDTYVFYWKIALVVLGGVNVLYFTMLDEVWAVGSGDDAPPMAKSIAASAIVVWLGVLFCGHMLPFLGVSF